MIRAKNYKTVTKFVKVISRILWPLFFRTRCIRGPIMKALNGILMTQRQVALEWRYVM